MRLLLAAASQSARSQIVSQNCQDYPGGDNRNTLEAVTRAFRVHLDQQQLKPKSRRFLPEWGIIQSDSEPNDQDQEAGSATGSGRGPLESVSTVSSACTSASPEAPYFTEGSNTGDPYIQLPTPPPVTSPSCRRPIQTLVAESPSPLPVCQRQNIPETPPGVQGACATVPEASLSIGEISTIPQETPLTQRLPFKMTQASKAKMTLGLLNIPKVYILICNSLKTEIQNVGWVNKNTSGLAAFNALCLYSMNLPYLNSFLPFWTGVDSYTHGALARALQWLIGDIGTKDKLSRGQGDRQFKDVAGDSDDDDDGGAQTAGRCAR
ncbi:uncharacterized protein H6S33_006610 [Morchella sextelata]|uniref:uncharacterized protein n=1 Tax=Morchella sextelata TaxID=1174677 RepID=UPI001D0386C3|nr:uncharacterized protein H6S33_006610 [Morchella sextelata]KAH0604233.1 hypothetical protein H6S33_006610 [Morchella sextelata]